MTRILSILLLLPLLCLAQNTEVGPIGNTPQKIDTLAGLVGRPGTNSQMLVVLGHDAVGDWGGQRNAVFDAGSTQATNLGCVFEAPGGRWKFPDCETGEVHVGWFGADPTGVLASGAAIQAAMTNGAGVINFGRGTYLIDQTLSPGNHTVLKGESKAMAGLFPTDYPTVLKAAPGLNAPILRSNGEEFTIDGIAFNGDRTTQAGFSGTALVELLGGANFIETFLSNVYISDSKTNALYINRTEVRVENCKIVWNDGDGILIGVGENDWDPVVVDFPIRDIQVGFNRGYGINARRAFNIRMIGADIYQNNLGGLRLANSSLFRGFGLQLDKNGGHGFSMESNCRWIHVVTGIIYDANWQIFNNYYDATPEETNSAPEGTFSNVYISTTGVKESILFEAVHFAINEGAGYSGLTRPGYEFHDARSNAGQGVTLINPIFSESTNHYAYGMMGGVSFTNLATIISAKYWGEGSRDTTLLNNVNRLTIRDTFYEWPLSVQVAATNLSHAPIAGFWRNNAEAWTNYNPVTAEMILGRLQFAGMSGTNALGWRTPLAIEGAAIYDWNTNYNPAFIRFRIAPDDSTALGVQAAVLNSGRFFLTPQASHPTNYPGQGQLYFNNTIGLHQYRGTGWEPLWSQGSDGPGSGLDADTLDGNDSSVFVTGGPYLPLAGGSPYGPITSSSTFYGTLFEAQGSGAAIWTRVRGATNDTWGFYSQTAFGGLKAYWRPGTGSAYDVFTLNTNGSLGSIQGTFWNSGNDGSGSTLDADLLDGFHASAFLQDAPSTGSVYGRSNATWAVVSSGTSYSFTNGLTNSANVVSWSAVPGSNISFATNNGQITISSSTGTTNSGTAVSVDGAATMVAANFADSTELNPTASGSNVTYAIVTASIATNKIDATFHGLLTAADLVGSGTNIFVNAALVSLANLQDDTGAGGINWAVSGSNIKAYATNVAHGLTFTNGLTNAANVVQWAVSAGTNVTLTTNNGQITIAASATGTSYSFTNGLTNSAGVVQWAVAQGANVTLTTNNGQITIAASTGSTNDLYIAKNVTKVSISNTVDETTVYAWTIPADTLNANGDELEFYVPAKYLEYNGQTNGYRWDFYIDRSQPGESATTGNYVNALASISTSFMADWTVRVKRMSATEALLIAKHICGADGSGDTTNVITTSRYLEHTIVNGWDQDMDFELTFTPGVTNMNHGIVAYGSTVRKLR